MRGLTPRRPLFTGFLAVFLCLSAFYLRGQVERAPQPIAYNHAKHIAAGLNCTDCHAGARDGERATLPELSTCLGCHENALTASSEETKLRELAAAGRDLAWSQVTRVPPHVYFSHARHVSAGRIECATCHGPMEKATAPPVRPFRAMTMDACIDCHRQHRARTECNDCHR